MKTIVTLIAAVLLIAGCSGSSGSEGGEARDQTRQQAAAQSDANQEAQDDLADKVAAAAVVDIVIKGGKVTPQGKRIAAKVGQKITLHITSDADEEVHVHSEPEHEYELAPGDDKTYSFTIKTPGQVAVEAHHLDVTIAQLVVRP